MMAPTRSTFLFIVLLFAVVSTSLCSYKVNLQPSEKKYKFLMLLLFGGESHRNCFIPLAEALADRGHEVVILSGLPPKSKHPNVKELNHGLEFTSTTGSMFERREKDSTLDFFNYILPRIAREAYDAPVVKEVFAKRDQFDLFFVNGMFNEPAFPFLEGRKFITIIPAGNLVTISAALGNVLNPSYVPLLLSSDVLASFPSRVKNLFMHIVFAVYWRYYAIYPAVEKELSAKFPNFPGLAEIERNTSLVLSNDHFSMDIPIPLLPSQVEVGGMHCRPGKQLPKELRTFIEESGPEGVIYFSLGSVCKGSMMPEKYRTIIIEAFSKLKQRVIWKFEEEIKGLPSNIKIQEWLPQQDILAHPKVKLFITHGGLLSMQESLFHGKPLLALPVFGDQEKNAGKIRYKEFGDFLFWEELTTDLLLSTIKELMNNPKYKKNVDKVSASFRDQLIPPLEKAVWWTEYVVRHNGAPQLKSPASELSWIEYLMIDVILAIHIILFLTFWSIRKILKVVFKLIFSSKSKKTKFE